MRTRCEESLPTYCWNCEPHRFVTIREAAQRFQVCQASIYYWIEHGWVSHLRTPGEQIRIYQMSLDDLVTRRIRDQKRKEL